MKKANKDMKLFCVSQANIVKFLNREKFTELRYNTRLVILSIK